MKPGWTLSAVAESWPASIVPAAPNEVPFCMHMCMHMRMCMALHNMYMYMAPTKTTNPNSQHTLTHEVAQGGEHVWHICKVGAV